MGMAVERLIVPACRLRRSVRPLSLVPFAAFAGCCHRSSFRILRPCNQLLFRLLIQPSVSRSNCDILERSGFGPPIQLNHAAFPDAAGCSRKGAIRKEMTASAG
jgi:hypothetical protein